ncbi:9917_t:CDS:2 [Gigaspora rosea]|nr:9917_t:CDS:2 [Gigaspora rosea]
MTIGEVNLAQNEQGTEMTMKKKNDPVDENKAKNVMISKILKEKDKWLTMQMTEPQEKNNLTGLPNLKN